MSPKWVKAISIMLLSMFVCSTCMLLIPHSQDCSAPGNTCARENPDGDGACISYDLQPYGITLLEYIIGDTGIQYSEGSDCN